MLVSFFRIVGIHQISHDWETINSSMQIMVNKFEANTLTHPPEILLNMLIAGEDRRFLYHHGFDFRSILRAFLKNILSQKLEGASTIEQQLVRTIIDDYRISYCRKLKEIVLANLLARNYSKKNIIFAYLHSAYFGAHMHGFIRSCYRLKIDHNAMSELEAANLIARLKYPEPSKNSQSQYRKIRFRVTHLLKVYSQYNRRQRHYVSTVNNAIQEY